MPTDGVWSIVSAMRKVAATVLLFACLTASLRAAASFYMAGDRPRLFYAPSISIDCGGTLTVPLSENMKSELKLPRSSASAALNLALLSVQIGPAEIHTGPFGMLVSDSIHVGSAYVSANFTIGYGLMVVFHPSQNFSLGIGYRLGISSTIVQSDVKRAVHIAELRPEINIKTFVEDNIQIVLPIRALYSVDYMTASVGIGIRWLHSRIMKAPLWLLEQQRLEKGGQK